MEFRKIKIADLIPASYNPRKKLKPGDKEYQKIKNSIMEFGYVEPVIVNSDMTIIGGHQRVSVLSDLGYGNYSALSKKSPKNCRNFLMLFKKLSTRQGLSCFVSQ